MVGDDHRPTELCRLVTGLLADAAYGASSLDNARMMLRLSLLEPGLLLHNSSC